MVNKMQQQVLEFMKAMGQTTPGDICLPDEKTVKLRIDLMKEELLGEDELVDSMWKGDIVGIADGIADLLYVVYGTAVAYGLDMELIFEEVHRSNMSKLQPDGTVLRREDGKILKPDTYSRPNLRPLIYKKDF